MLLMVAHMNAEALALTLETGIAHYWSRSRNALWKKGETSGNFQHVVEMRTDCDQDALWLRVKVSGHDATCHTGRRSCFYRTVGLVGRQGDACRRRQQAAVRCGQHVSEAFVNHSIFANHSYSLISIRPSCIRDVGQGRS